MLYKFPGCHTIIAFVLSVILALSVAQPTRAKTSSVKQIRADIYCSISAGQPYKAGQSITAYGSVDCNEPVKQVKVTLQVQKSATLTPGGEWATLWKKDEVFDKGPYSSNTLLACSLPKQTLYRTYVTAEYQTASGWHAIPAHDESYALIACGE